MHEKKLPPNETRQSGNSRRLPGVQVVDVIMGGEQQPFPGRVQAVKPEGRPPTLGVKRPNSNEVTPLKLPAAVYELAEGGRAVVSAVSNGEEVELDVREIPDSPVTEAGSAE